MMHYDLHKVTSKVRNVTFDINNTAAVMNEKALLLD